MEALFLKILNMSLSAAAVICVVVLVRLALKRTPKKWSYLLWTVVAFRLVCPVSLSAPFSILRLAAQPAAVTESASGAGSAVTYIPQDIGFMASPRVYVGPPAVSNAVSSSLPAAAPMNSANPLQIWITVGTALWCLGMAALLLYGIISYVNLRLRLRGAVRTENGVFETDAVRSPFILGLLHPVIYLPAGLEGEPLRYVLAHERFHIRRGDHAVKLLAFALLCVHWFNPLVWLAFYLMSRDMEMRCDEAVLSAEQGITKPYSMALLSFATARRFPSPSPLTFGETGVKQRIRNALRWRKPKVWVTVLCALVCTTAVAACAVNPAGNEKTNAPTGTPWDWTSTVQLSDVKGFAEGRGITLSHSQMKELIRLLNAVRPEEVVRGRGIPSDKTLDITTGVGYRLRWGGGVIELDFNDAAAAAKLYGGAGEPGPGVWEIHNEALYAFLDGLDSEAPAPPAATNLLETTPNPTPQPTAAPDASPLHSLPRFRNAEGAEVYLNMELAELNAALDTSLQSGYIYTLPQHVLSVAAGHMETDGHPTWPVVELAFYKGWTPSKGPGIGATVEEVKAFWGEPDGESDPNAVNPAKLYGVGYVLTDGYLEFVHRSDGVIESIDLYNGEVLANPEADGAPTLGNRVYWHGRGSAHIEPFNCFGALDVICAANKNGRYRMALTDAEGTETVLAEGEGSFQKTIPSPRIENGALDVEIDADSAWSLAIDWFPRPGAGEGASKPEAIA